jgi:hypothetical protein
MISRLRECLAFAGCHMEAQVHRVNAFAGPARKPRALRRREALANASPEPSFALGEMPIDEITKMSTNNGS